MSFFPFIWGKERVNQWLDNFRKECYLFWANNSAREKPPPPYPIKLKSLTSCWSAFAWSLHQPKQKYLHSEDMSVLRLSFSDPSLLPSGLLLPTQIDGFSAYSQVCRNKSNERGEKKLHKSEYYCFRNKNWYWRSPTDLIPKGILLILLSPKSHKERHWSNSPWMCLWCLPEVPWTCLDIFGQVICLCLISNAFHCNGNTCTHFVFWSTVSVKRIQCQVLLFFVNINVWYQ